MASNNIHRPVEIPDNFLKILAGLWVLFTISLGSASCLIFTTAIELYIEGKLIDSFIYAGIYSFIFLFLFGITWKPLLLKFPLSRPGILLVHGIVQMVNSLIGFGLGFVITEAIHDYMYASEHIEAEGMEMSIFIIALLCMIGILATNGFFYATAYMRRSFDSEKRRVDSELSALRAQINPHFLFNSLNSIAALIRISPEEAEAVTEDLADVFRYTLRASDTPLVCLKDELEIINLYLNIEQARFKERLKVEINVPDNLLNVSVPVLTLQPLVENAIKHGVGKKEGNHIVRVEARNSEPLLELEISDTGPGFPHNNFEKLMERGTGLSNVFQRLKLHFGEQVDGAVSDKGLILRFPITPQEDHTHFEPNQRGVHERISG